MILCHEISLQVITAFGIHKFNKYLNISYMPRVVEIQ